MTLRIYTARLPHHGCPGYVGADRLDVTRGTGGGMGDPFAPSEDLKREGLRRRNAAKRAPAAEREAALAAAWEWYAPRYIEEMRASYQRNREAWHTLIASGAPGGSGGEITLCCYCGTVDQCHRTVLASLLVAVARRLGWDVRFCGERQARVERGRQEATG